MRESWAKEMFGCVASLFEWQYTAHAEGGWELTTTRSDNKRDSEDILGYGHKAAVGSRQLMASSVEVCVSTVEYSFFSPLPIGSAQWT